MLYCHTLWKLSILVRIQNSKTMPMFSHNLRESLLLCFQVLLKLRSIIIFDNSYKLCSICNYCLVLWCLVFKYYEQQLLNYLNIRSFFFLPTPLYIHRKRWEPPRHHFIMLILSCLCHLDLMLSLHL